MCDWAIIINNEQNPYLISAIGRELHPIYRNIFA